MNIGFDTDGVSNNYEAYAYGVSLPHFASHNIRRYKKSENQIIIITEQTDYNIENNYGIYKLMVDPRICSIVISPHDYEIMMKLGAFDVIKQAKICNIIIDPKVSSIIKNSTTFNVKDIYNIPKIQRDLFWLRHIWEYCIAYPPREHAVELFRDVRQKGDKSINITSRQYVQDNSFNGKLWRKPLFRKMLYDYYKNYGIEFDNIVLCREKESSIDKRKACEDYNIHIMIDDQTDNALAISEVADEILLMNASYNQDCEGENITRIFNLYQAHDFIDAYRNNDRNELNKIKTLIKNEGFNYKSRIYQKDNFMIY